MVFLVVFISYFVTNWLTFLSLTHTNKQWLFKKINILRFPRPRSDPPPPPDRFSRDPNPPNIIGKFETFAKNAQVQNTKMGPSGLYIRESSRLWRVGDSFYILPRISATTVEMTAADSVTFKNKHEKHLAIRILTVKKRRFKSIRDQ